MLFEICMEPPRPPAIPDDGILRNKKTGKPIIWRQVVTKPLTPETLAAGMSALKKIEDTLFTVESKYESASFDGLDQLVDSHKPGKY